MGVSELNSVGGCWRQNFILMMHSFVYNSRSLRALIFCLLYPSYWQLSEKLSSTLLSPSMTAIIWQVWWWASIPTFQFSPQCKTQLISLHPPRRADASDKSPGYATILDWFLTIVVPAQWWKQGKKTSDSSRTTCSTPKQQKLQYEWGERPVYLLSSSFAPPETQWLSSSLARVIAGKLRRA
jgi:hypothetical protein